MTGVKQVVVSVVLIISVDNWSFEVHSRDKLLLHSARTEKHLKIDDMLQFGTVFKCKPYNSL